MRSLLRCIAPAVVAIVAIVGLAASSAPSAAAGARHARERADRVSTVRPSHSPVHVDDFGNYQANGYFINLTPYVLTFAASGSEVGNPVWGAFPKTLNPGERFIYHLNTYDRYRTTERYSGWFTYKADTLSGTEYLSLDLEGSHCWFICESGDGPPLNISAHDTTALPQRQKNGAWSFGPNKPNSEIVSTGSGSAAVFGGAPAQNFDYTFEAQGNHDIDASKLPTNQSGMLAEVINGLCATKGLATCAFTATSPLTFGSGKATLYYTAPNCSINAPGEEPLPAQYKGVTVTQTRESSLSVGGSVSVGFEAEVFHVIEVGVSVKFGVEHEWTDDSEFSKKVGVYIPAGWLGAVFVAPEIGKVTGTMTMKTSKASYTITNLTDTKDGVQPDLATPPYDLMFDARPMTQDEYAKECKKSLQSEPPPSGGRG